MVNALLVTDGNTGSLDYIRAKAVMSVVARMKKLAEQDYTIPVATNKQISDASNALKNKGCLSFSEKEDAICVNYIPSIEAKQNLVDDGTNSKWDSAVVKRQQKSIRVTKGALFKLPLENGGGTIDCFITDWSPFPVAAGVAVHKDHPAIYDVKKNQDNYFTGKFVRHPLTGDLIPVFVADWVKPEFGTGAVIINPAHNQADLDFARSTGLPIRFGLVPHEVTSDPATWPSAPVIKTGRSTKTGRYDNLSPDEAAGKYFVELNSFGHASMFTDIGIGAYQIYKLTRDNTGEYLFNTNTHELKDASVEANSEDIRVTLSVSSVFSEIVAADFDGKIDIISEVSEIESSLVFARCLAYDVHQQTLIPDMVFQVQKVQEVVSANNANPNSVELAVLVQAPNNQMAVLKKQILEQTDRFLKNHESIKGDISEVICEEKDVNKKQYGKIRDLMISGNYQNAFNSLYTIQKTLMQSFKGGTVNLNAVKCYFALTYAFLGDKYPDDFAIADIWKSL